MQNTVQYNKQKHGESFMDEWLPHREASDIWQFQGIVHEIDAPQSIYSFRLVIYKINYLLEPFYAIHYNLSDILKTTDYTESIVIPIKPGKKIQLSFDEESLLFADMAQVLDTEHAVVLKLRGNEFAIELRLDKDYQPVWYGDDGKVFLARTPKESRAIFCCALPRMNTFGRITLAERDFRVQGISAIERSWGKMPLKSASTHWERFYLFFDDMDEMALINLPLAGHMDGIYLHHNLEPMRIREFSLEPVEYIEIDEWRFSSRWELNIPAINRGPYYLIPLIKSQFALPVCRPFVGIFDQEGKRYGYGYGELHPGARNELDTISLSFFKNANPDL